MNAHSRRMSIVRSAKVLELLGVRGCLERLRLKSPVVTGDLPRNGKERFQTISQCIGSNS